MLRDLESGEEVPDGAEGARAVHEVRVLDAIASFGLA